MFSLKALEAFACKKMFEFKKFIIARESPFFNPNMMVLLCSSIIKVIFG